MRFRVPTVRLSRIRAILAFVQRPDATGSPARWTTTSAPASGAGPDIGSHRRSPEVRPSVMTPWPRERASSHSRLPMNPVAPVTAIFIAGAKITADPPPRYLLGCELREGDRAGLEVVAGADQLEGLHLRALPLRLHLA